ncbi:MAG: RNA polymerase sigma factor [Planctomycetota bacterium]
MTTPNREQDKRLMRIALQRLPESHREIVQALYTQKLTAEELAGHLGLSPATVASRLKEGTALLKQIMQELRAEAQE